MAGSRRRRQLQRQRERKLSDDAAAAPAAAPGQSFQLHHLPPDLLPEIHRRLAFLTRLAFAAVCGASGTHLRPETPWLILANNENSEDRARAWSIADGKSAAVRVSDAAMRGHVAVGSSGGWLVTADDRGALRLANPVTGAHAELPAITTLPCFRRIWTHWFSVYERPYLKARFGDGPLPLPDDCLIRGRSYTVTAAQMRQLVYRKVVLSSSPSPSPGSRYTAMLIFDRSIGAPAFATTDANNPVPSWKMARSPDAIEDAIYHDGRFVSITHTGRVQAWRRDAETGEFAGEEVAPRVAYEDKHLRRRYIAAAADGRLMAVLKHAWDEDAGGSNYSRDKRTRVSFKVQVLDRAKGRWEDAAAGIGDAALFVGVNGTLCLSTREHQGIRAGCVYYTDDEVGEACLNKANCQQRSSSYGEPDDTELRDVGVYNLKTGKREALLGIGNNHQRWPPLAWFTPSFL